MMHLETVAKTLSHTEAWHAERRKGLGGSDAKRIMEGDWRALWLEKTGRADGEDLSGVLQVNLGSWTEAFNAYWFSKQTGLPLSQEDCAHIAHPAHDFMKANLDGRVGLLPFEAKHVSAFAKDEEIVERYYPQCQHNLAVCAASNLYLSVLFGNHKWAYWQVEADPDYQTGLIEREADFWRHVVEDREPKDTTAEKVAIAFDDMREADMTGHNEFAANAASWIENRTAAKAFKSAESGLKDLVEGDVRRAFGYGVEINRAKNGALRIKEMKP